METYIQKNPGPNPDRSFILAGYATHNESAFLQELVVRRLLEESKPFIVDGSLSNVDWCAAAAVHVVMRSRHSVALTCEMRVDSAGTATTSTTSAPTTPSTESGSCTSSATRTSSGSGDLLDPHAVSLRTPLPPCDLD